VICAEAVAMALVPTLGKTTAHRIVEDACRQALARDIPLRTVLADIPQVTALLSADELDRLCDPRNATGLADQLIQRALAQHSGAARWTNAAFHLADDVLATDTPDPES